MAKRKTTLYPGNPAIPVLDKYRRAADPDRQAYGRAVMAAVRALQRRELAREAPPHPCPCASGTWESDGQTILAAVRQQNRRRA
jgi:hypothetical protein